MALPDDISKWSHLQGIDIPQVPDNEITLLIGQDVPEAQAPLEVRRSPMKGAPYAIRTELGWSVCGSVGGSAAREVATHYIQHVSIDQALERFWKIEDPAALELDVKSVSREDASVLSLWKESVTHANGHYVLPIPFKDRTTQLPDSRVVARRRLHLLGKRLDKDPSLDVQYNRAFEELLANGFAEECTEQVGRVWYIPHHVVVNEHKEKIRVVFDCAAKTNGLSLNDQVHSGPDLTNSLVGVLLRFRQYQIAIVGDLEAMFHQVSVAVMDKNMLRFLWWPNGDRMKEPRTYRMTVHLFGGTWSPSAANFALHQTATDFASDQDHEVHDTIHKNFYVDDLLKSVKTEEEAKVILERLIKILDKGGFVLKKLISNSNVVLSNIPLDRRAVSARNLDDKTSAAVGERTLGVRWDISNDQFRFAVKNNDDKPYTRRSVLSIVCSIFDPCGFLSPVILIAKKFVQDMTRQKLGWDDPLPTCDEQRWKQWLAELQDVTMFTIDRCLETALFGGIKFRQLIHFADASRYAYGAVSYLRLVNNRDEVRCILLLSKSKLAPMKGQTIPRLELMAASLAVKQDSVLRKELQLSIDESVYFTDSMIVLHYINNETKRFSVFVTNRLAEIHARSLPAQWHHIRSELNPADKVSRGVFASQLVNDSSWTRGPEFMWQQHMVYESIDTALFDNAELEEVEKCVVNHTVVWKSGQQGMTTLITHFSSWYRVKRAVAWILRVRTELRCRVLKKKNARDHTK